MSERFDKLMKGIDANKLTIEELEAVVEVLEAVKPLGSTETTALAKMRWHIKTAHNEGDE